MLTLGLIFLGTSGSVWAKNKFETEKIKSDETVRVEKTVNRVLLYSNEFEKLEYYTKSLTTADYYLRQSNLEDVFLNLTGRQLRE